MSTSSLRITLKNPVAHQIVMNDELAQVIGLTTPVIPHGMARLTIDTTANWEARLTYIPSKGEIVVYSDRNVINGVEYPGVKIGDGRAYGIDLPFVGDDSIQSILNLIGTHMSDTNVHLIPGERTNWNNKVSCSVDGERLIFEGDD